MDARHDPAPPFTRQTGLRFGLTVGAAFIALASLTWWRGAPRLAGLFGSLGAGLVLLGLLIPGRLGPVYRAWMGLAHLISKVTTPIFLGIVYFLVLMPVGLVRRLIAGNPIVHPDSDGSYWVRRDPEARRSDLERQF